MVFAGRASEVMAVGETERDSRVGTRIGRYRLIRLLGKGGMGEVYEAEDTVKDRIVALKLLPEAVSHDPMFRKRLEREAKSAGRLQEPHVVPVHDYGEIDGLLYVDMRLIDGTDLRKELKRFGPMQPARAVAIVRQIASALDAAHEAGVIHRDVKPENVVLTGDDFAYLLDFGIANAATDTRLTEMGSAVGTYAYMAPERFTSDEVTYRVDIYALTSVLYECLVGSQPYSGESVSVVITAHLMQPIPRPSEVRPGIPKAFDDVIARGLAKKPEDRYASAGELAQAATDALTAPDREKAATLLEQSQSATLPGAAIPTATPTVRPSPSTPPTTPHVGRATPPPTSRSQPPTPPPFTRPTTPIPPQVSSPTPPVGVVAAYPSPPVEQPFAAVWPPTPIVPPAAVTPPAVTPPTAPPPEAPESKRKIWMPVAILGGVVVLVLGGLAIWRAVESDDPPPPPPVTNPPEVIRSTQPTTPASKTPTETPITSIAPNADSADARLLSLLPRDYADGACELVHPPVTGALATADCGSSKTPGASTVARYSLYPDLATLNTQFSSAIAADSQLLQCPGLTVDSPTTWHYTTTPDKVEGQLACGIYNNRANLVWTHESDLLLGDVQGNDHVDLHDWWAKYA